MVTNILVEKDVEKHIVLVEAWRTTFLANDRRPTIPVSLVFFFEETAFKLAFMQRSEAYERIDTTQSTSNIITIDRYVGNLMLGCVSCPKLMIVILSVHFVRLIEFVIHATNDQADISTNKKKKHIFLELFV